MTARAPDSERDAWLSQALRHAPDANADAPPALSETILREARRAAARPAASAPRTTPAPRRANRAHWFLSAWDWLARPPVAAGFASVMVATLVGMMWWDRPLDQTLPRPPDTISAPPPAQVEVAPAVPITPAPRDVPRADPTPAVPAARTVEQADAAPAAPAPRAIERADAPPQPLVAPPESDTQARAPAPQGTAMKESARSASPSKPVTAAARSRTDARQAPAATAASPTPPALGPQAATQPAATAGAVDDGPTVLAQRRELAAATAKAAAPPMPLPPAPAPQTEAATHEQAPAQLVQRRALATPAAKGAAESSSPAATDKAALHQDELRATQGGAGPSRARTQAADSVASPLAELLASVAQQPERWRWQRGSADPKPMTPELERWLMQLDKDTAARWRSVAQRAPHDRAGALSLWRDGVLQATLGFAQAAVWVDTSGAPVPEPTPATALAALPASSLEALRKALDDATP